MEYISEKLMNDFIYSIIIPHKNIPDLLQRCIDSIPQRDDVQVIVVDDNSDPEKVDFTNFPGLNRPNTEVYFDKTGRGAGRARNVGLEHAKGEWVLFADADDYFNYCIDEVLNKHINSTSDIVYFDSCSLDCYTYANSHRSAYTHEMIKLYYQNKSEGEFQLRYYLGVPWGKIISRDLIMKNGIKFDETPINNDTTFAYLCGFYAYKIEVEPLAAYCITTRSGSISVSPSDEKTLACIDVFVRKYKFLSEHGIEIVENFVYNNLTNLRVSGRVELYEECMNVIRKYGYDESFLQKKRWAPHFSYHTDGDTEDFLWSHFGSNMLDIYTKKGNKFRLMLFFLNVLSFITKIKESLYRCLR